MKYQYILNGILEFETDSASDFMTFLLKEENRQVRNSVLFNLLKKSDGYKAKMIAN